MEIRLSAVQGDERKRWFTKTLHAAAEALSKALVHLPSESALTLSAAAECRFSRFEVMLLESPQLPVETRFKAVLDGSRWKDLRSSIPSATAQLAGALLVHPAIAAIAPAVKGALNEADIVPARARFRRLRPTQADPYPVHATVLLPASVALEDRDRLSDQLEALLGERGRVSGGGAGILGVTLDVDLKEAADVTQLLQTLGSLQAPAGTKVECDNHVWAV